MVTVLLIGLKYRREFKELPGIIIDLYRGYIFAKKINAEIRIITDIVTNENVRLLNRSIFMGEVRDNIISFISDIKRNNEHIGYVDSDTLVSDIIKVVSNVTKLVVYYTGHGNNGYLLLPRREKLSIVTFRDSIITNMSSDGYLVSIMDCCNGDHMGIPFLYRGEGDGGGRESDYRLIRREQRIFPSQKIIHITSTRLDENSIATSKGSIFTGQIFRNLMDGQRDIRKVVTMVTKRCRQMNPQTASLYVSRPNIYVFWRWMFKKEWLDIDVEYLPEIGIVNIQFIKHEEGEEEKEESPSVCAVADFGSHLSYRKVMF